jgi:DNA-binding NarL/FixJ family response regulator
LDVSEFAHLPNKIGDTIRFANTSQVVVRIRPPRGQLNSNSPEVVMSIKVLLADDSDVMRPAIVRLLKEEPLIKLVGEATSFAETLRLTAALKPDVLLMDLHMRDEGEYPPELVKSQVLLNTKCILAISVWNDADAKALAESFGAKVLLDKNNLFSELIPAITQFCPNVTIPKIANSVRKMLKQASVPAIQSQSADEA